MSDTKKEERFPCIILGKEIGTYTSWDHYDYLAIQFYNFKPNELGERFLKNDPACMGAQCDIIMIHFATGEVGSSDGENKIEVDWSVFNAL